jgi:hypothetical protein
MEVGFSGQASIFQWAPPQRERGWKDLPRSEEMATVLSRLPSALTWREPR